MPDSGPASKKHRSGDAPPPVADVGPGLRDGSDKEEEEGQWRKRKRAVLFGYAGRDFHGLQAHTLVSPPHDTVENALHRALVAAQAIAAVNADSLHKIGWSRCARTDRGVSAASQVVAGKLCVPGREVNGEASREDMEKFLAAVNAHLPPTVRVFKVMRVPNGFNSQHAASGRIYGYLFPASLLGPAPELALARLNAGLARFVGTKRYHNFTDKVRASDPSAQRVIRECFASAPQAVGATQVVRVTFNGQSFLLHQIRRMMGFVLEAVRRTGGDAGGSGGADERKGEDVADLVDKALHHTIIVQSPPTAPAEGLFLDAALFEDFNRSLDRLPVHSDGPPAQQPIDFVHDPVVSAAREALIREVIMPQMLDLFDVFERWRAERDLVRDFPEFRVAGEANSALGDAEHFLRHVAETRHHRWTDGERDRRS
jgi:tRNA pseudouridine38-40 synthase